jgi:O-antigen/teichoic acid export membrane protein
MLIQDSAIYMVAKLLPGLFSLATTAALTRLLDPHEYGLYGLALVVMTLGSIILFDWLGLSFLRFYQSRRDDSGLLSTFLCMFGALVIASAAALGAALISGVVPADLVGTYVVGLLMVWACAWFELNSKLAVAEFQPMKVLRMNLGRSLLVLVGATTAAWLTRSPLWTAMGSGAGIFVGAFFGRVPIPRLSWRRFDRDLARNVVVFGAPMAASMALFTLIDGGTRILLERLDSAQALGLYTAASVLAQSTIGVIAAGVSSAGYSLVVREVERGDHTGARRQLLANGTLLLAVLAPTSLGIALTGNCIATTFLGSRFVSGVAPLMLWIAANSFFNSLRCEYLDHAFHLGKKPHLQIWVMGLAGIVAVGLSFYLIPKYGPIGAAAAVTVAYAVACAHSLIAGRYAYPIPLPIAAGIRVGICCVMMAFVVVQLPDSGWSGLVLRATLGSGTYAIAALAINLLDSQEHAVRFAKRAARWWTAFRSNGALRKFR